MCAWLPAAAQLTYSGVPSAYGLYRPKDTSLHYNYVDSTETIDLSGNWDIDGDGKKDSIFFVGNGGAHLYFSLRLVLSSDKVVRDLHWLQTDMPCLGDAAGLAGPEDAWPQIVVDDLDGDGLTDIFMTIDKKFSPIPEQWKKRGVTSRHVLVNYKTIKDYKVK